MTKPCFSIITVTKNNLSGLRRTDASIRAQTYQNYEWLIIDGASTDGTLGHYNPAISEPDSGIYDAMNKGITLASGDYLIFMNAGDVFAAGDTLEILSGHDADFIYGDARENGQMKPARHDISHGMITHHQAMAYRRAAIGILRFDPAYSIAADYDFTWRFMQRSLSHLYIPIPVCDFESGGVSQANAARGRKEQFAIRRKMGCSHPFCASVYVRQYLVWIVRQYAPDFFWRMRSRRNTAPSPAHNRTRPGHPENRGATHTHT